MSSSEEYLDSLLDSILGGGKSEEEEKAVPEESQESQILAENKVTEAGKAMSPDEIEEMLVSMGTLGGGEEDAKEQDSKEQDSEEDMEAMLAFMDEHNAEASDSDGSDDSAIDELSLDSLLSEEPGADGDAPDVSDDLSLDDLSLDDLSSGEETDSDASDDSGDLALDDLDMGESGTDDSAADELALEDLSLDEPLSEEPEEEADSDALDDLGDLSLDDLSSEEPEADGEESGSDDFAIEELSLDDLSSEEPESTEDGLMSEEDIDRLLNGDMSEETGDEAVEDLALEETGDEGDDDLSELLAGMGHDEDLSEINDLLEESDQGLSADDDMLAMLEGVDADGDSSFDLFESDEAAKEAESIRELSPEEVAAREGGDPGKKKKKKKLFGKKKKGGDEETPSGEGAGDELEALLGEVSAEQEMPQEEKNPGFFARLLDFLLESEEDDEDPLAAEILAGNEGETGTVTDENKELLKELSDEDKKGKKKKKKKDKKGKKGKEAEEDEKKAKKPKKVKKKKEKPKKEEEEDLFAPPTKPLSKKKVITVFLFCGTIAACIIVFSTIVPETIQKQDAHAAYDQGDYAEVYDLLYGKELNEQDEVLFQGSNLILQMDRKLSSYDNYVNLDMRTEALNALVTGVERYQQILPEAESYNVAAEVNDIYAQILERLSAFGLTEQDALDILASEDDVTYTQRLEAVINGESVDEEEAEVGIQDVLPEEEEIIERIGGTDAEPEDIPEESSLEVEMPDDQAEDEFSSEGAE